jgi:hypothetical protein
VPKTFTNAILPASDLNSFMLQPGTAGTGTRLVSGTTADSFAASSSDTGTISFGFTFSSAPKVIAVVQIGSNFDVAINWTGAPTTTNVGYRVFQVNGTSITGAYTIYWVAIGPA